MATITFSANSFLIDETELVGENKQDKLFSRILIALLALYLVFGVIVPMFERVEVPRAIQEKVPVQLTRVLLQEKEKEVVPPKVIEEEPEPEPEPIEEEKPKEPPKTKREAAKEKAKSSGLAAMKDELFSLREAFVVKPKQGELIKAKAAEAAVVKRKLLAAKANEQSQSIVAAQATKTVASDELSSHQTQTVRLAEEEILADSAGSEVGEDSLANVRSEMKLRQTLEANKARLYSLYNRALRKNPFLKGKVLFEIEIQPNGRVSNVIIQSSELADQALEKRLMSILKSINFGEEDVDVISTVWAIEFLPR
ncbi:MAG: AgmX/PglI C-terminal domain-containing protein [Thalassotalea sp.]